MNNFYAFKPYLTNYYFGNKASYGADFTTFPYKLLLINKEKISKLAIVPGNTVSTLKFQFLDYYNKNVSINTTTSMQLFQMKKHAMVPETNVKINGAITAVARNGIFNHMIKI